MFDVKPGPLEGSECLMLSLGPGRVRRSDVKPWRLEGSERFMFNSSPNGRKHKKAAKWLRLRLTLTEIAVL